MRCEQRPRSPQAAWRRVVGAPLVVCLSLALAWAPAAADELVDAPAAALVRGHCSACHALTLVTAQRGDAGYWRDIIRWMQRTQNLWEIPEAQEAEIVEYLAEHYAESEWGRRPNLPPQLQGVAGAQPID